MLGIGSIIFLRKFFQGLRSDPKFKALFLRDEDVEQNIKHLDKVMERYLNGLDEYYSDIEEYDRVEIRDIYENDIKPLLREKKLVDMEDIVNYLSYKLDYLNKQKEKKFFSKD
jgi:truncated hemoglobin YjbI